MRIGVVAGVFAPRGPAAEEISGLWWFLLVLGGIAFVPVAALLLAALRRPRTADPDQDALAPPSARLTRTLVVGGGVGLSTVLLSAVLAASVWSTVDLTVPPDPDRLVVEVTGHQWWWEFRYRGQGVVTASELHLPVGVGTELRLQSEDVIHSFWIPQLHGKLDLLPEHGNVLVLEPGVPGRFAGQCAEFCGLHHATMRLTVVAHEPAEFVAWLEAQRGPAPVPQADSPEGRGRATFLAAGCGRCHRVAGTTEAEAPRAGQSDVRGPDLTHLASRRRIAGGLFANDAEGLARWVSHAGELKPDAGMPSTPLPPEELDELVAYLEHLS